jgi:hypothetical protein
MGEKGYFNKFVQGFRFKGGKEPQAGTERSKSPEINRDGQVMVEVNLIASRCVGKTIEDVRKTF